METINDYKNYFGLDVSLEISLFEYGLIAEKEGDKLNFVYGIGIDEDGIYNKFDNCQFSLSEIKELLNESLVYQKDVESFIGCKIELNDDFDYFRLISDLVSYYGYQNVFGLSYYGFEIEGIH